MLDSIKTAMYNVRQKYSNIRLKFQDMKSVWTIILRDRLWFILLKESLSLKGELNLDKKWQSDDFFYIIMNEIHPHFNQF